LFVVFIENVASVPDTSFAFPEVKVKNPPSALVSEAAVLSPTPTPDVSLS